jgi:hypothetical protein
MHTFSRPIFGREKAIHIYIRSMATESVTAVPIRSNPLNGDKFVYIDKDTKNLNFLAAKVTRVEPDVPNEHPCQFAHGQNYKCVHTPRSKLKQEWGLYPDWWGCCESCEKKFHLDCYVYFLCDTKNLDKVTSNGPFSTCVLLCGKGCLKKHIDGKKDTSSVVGKRWNNDGENGQSSLAILIDWLTTEPNYANYRSGGKTSEDAKTKEYYAKQIQAKMVSVGLEKRTIDAII